MILGHQFQRNELDRFMQIIYSFHMPMMFIISGYFIRTTTCIKDFIRRRAERLLLPYAFCCMVMTIAESLLELRKKNIMIVIKRFVRDVFVSLYGSGNGSGSYFYIKNKMWGTGDEIGMLWFLLALFWGSIIVKILASKRNGFFISIIISVLGVLSSKIVLLPFSIQNGIACTGWIYLGYEIRKQNLMCKINGLGFKSLYLFMGVIWAISALYGCTNLYENYYKLGIIDVLGAVCGCWIMYVVVANFAQRCKKMKVALTWLGFNTMGIYAMHFWENRICPLSVVLGKIIHISMSPFVTALISWIIIVSFSVFGTWVMGRITLCRRILAINES